MASNIETKIDRISKAVTSALSALTAKGVTVPDGANVESLAALIEGIEAGGGGGIKIEVFSLTPAEGIPASTTYEVGETTITNPHLCVCFDGTKADSSNSDTTKYHGMMAYVGCDETLWGEIGSAYNPKNFGLLYKKASSNNTYKRYNYGSSIAFNTRLSNSFYIENGKLYSNSSIYSATKWLFEAGRTYYILLIGGLT